MSVSWKSQQIQLLKFPIIFVYLCIYLFMSVFLKAFSISLINYILMCGYCFLMNWKLSILSLERHILTYFGVINIDIAIVFWMMYIWYIFFYSFILQAVCDFILEYVFFKQDRVGALLSNLIISPFNWNAWHIYILITYWYICFGLIFLFFSVCPSDFFFLLFLFPWLLLG